MIPDAVLDEAIHYDAKGRAFGGRKTGTSQGGSVRIGGGSAGGSGRASGSATGGRGPGGARVVAYANYVRGGKGSGGKMRESARYYMTRENEQGEREKRQAFSKDQDGMDFNEVKNRLKDHENNYHYRIVLAPETDKNAENGDLKEFTRRVMAAVQQRQDQDVPWIAVEHSKADAHTEHAHVHVIASVDRFLDKSDLYNLRSSAQLEWRLEIEQERVIQKELDRGLASAGLEHSLQSDQSKEKVQDYGLEL